MQNLRTRRVAGLLLALALVLGLGACGSAPTPTEKAPNGDAADITIPAVAGFDETIAVNELWKAILEEKGYNVTIEYVDLAVVFAGLAAGDYDFYHGIWLPVTHEEYIKKFGDQIEQVGVWNKEARNTFAVNADAPIDSIAELGENADTFGNRIVGIEAGAGLTGLTEDKVIPTYGLDGMEFVTSSTPAMLAELKSAMAKDEDIVVTLWEPHWAYREFELKNLKDPEGTLGEAEEMTIYSRQGFADDAPKLREWLSTFEMDLDRQSSLQAALFADNDDDVYDERVAAWIKENREWVDTLTPENS